MKWPLSGFDSYFAALAESCRSPALTDLMFWVTWLGKWQSLTIFFIAAVALFLRHKERFEALFLSFSFIGSLLFVYLLKTMFQRQRPEYALYFERTYSFPSAHAVVAITLYALLFYLLARRIEGRFLRGAVFTAGAVLALFIGISRIYLGVHYASDVLAGFALGLGWVLVVNHVLKRFCRSVPPFEGRGFRFDLFDALTLLLALSIFFIYWSIKGV